MIVVVCYTKNIFHFFDYFSPQRKSCVCVYFFEMLFLLLGRSVQCFISSEVVLCNSQCTVHEQGQYIAYVEMK